MHKPIVRLLIFFLALASSPVIASDQLSFNLVQQATIRERLSLYKGNDAKREATLKQLFIDAGCSSSSLVEQAIPQKKQPNLLCILPGTTEQTIVVGAHFDHVDRGDGIVDNWSGASLLPSFFQGLALQRQLRHTFIFAGFSGEEGGLYGSQFFIKHLEKSQRSRIEAMINLDTLGLGPTKIWIGQSDPRLSNLLNSVAVTMKLPVGGMELNGAGYSDEESFIHEKICTLMVHSLTSSTVSILHQPADNPSAIQFADYFDTYHLLAAYLAVLDSWDVPEGHVCTTKPVDK